MNTFGSPSQSLPARPSLEYHKKQAKSLLKAAKARGEEWQLADAQRAVAREYGFASWPRFRAHIDSLQPVAQPETPSLSSSEWDALIDRAEATGSIAFDARSLATDDVLKKLARLRRLKRLTLWRSPITDEGLRHLAGLTELTELNLGQCPGVTDAGLAVLRELPNLARFDIEHQHAITDGGMQHLAGHRHLQMVNLLGTNTGDGTLQAIAGNSELDGLRTGNGVTDRGLALLHDFPAYKEPQRHDPRIDILDDTTGVPWVQINLRAPVSDRGLENLAGLEGLGYLKLIGSVEHRAYDARENPITAAGIRTLAKLPNLVGFGAGPPKSGDAELASLAALPNLRYVSVQSSLATDAGFAALAASDSLEHLFAEDCSNITPKTLDSLSRSPRLRAVAVGGPGVRDADLGVLAQFRSLEQLIPVGAGEHGFRVIGTIESLEILDCMFCRRVSDQEIEQLAVLKHLKRFRIWGRELTDASLEMLSRMDSLEDLQFEGCRHISDMGIKRLATLPRLRVVSVLECPQVSRDALRGFANDVRTEWAF
jgi:hypothetical protein